MIKQMLINKFLLFPTHPRGSLFGFGSFRVPAARRIIPGGLGGPHLQHRVPGPGDHSIAFGTHHQRIHGAFMSLAHVHALHRVLGDVPLPDHHVLVLGGARKDSFLVGQFDPRNRLNRRPVSRNGQLVLALGGPQIHGVVVCAREDPLAAHLHSRDPVVVQETLLRLRGGESLHVLDLDDILEGDLPVAEVVAQQVAQELARHEEVEFDGLELLRTACLAEDRVDERVQV